MPDNLNHIGRRGGRRGAEPMAYLLAWRMEIAKELLLRDHRLTVSDVTGRWKGSTSIFSVAFSRHLWMPPFGMGGRGGRESIRLSKPPGEADAVDLPPLSNDRA